MKSVTIIVKYSDLSRFSLAYVLSILENYSISRRFVKNIILARDVVNEVLKCDSDIIVVMYSLMTPQIFDVEIIEELKMLRDLRKTHDLVLIAGGPHASGDPVGTLLRLGFDIAVLREGEITIPRLLDALVSYEDLRDVPNIVYRDGEKIIKTLDYIPDKIYTSCPYVDRFRIYAPLEIMRGCKHACKYCQTPRIYMFKVRYRSLDEIYRWCRHYYKIGIKTIRYLAPNGFAYGSKDCKRPNIKALENMLKTSYEAVEGKSKLVLGTFPSEVRPDFINRDVLEVVSKYVDNKKISIGVQTGSNRLLNYIGRGHNIECVYEAVDLCLEYGYTPCLDFIFGLPGETEEDVEITSKVMLEFAKKGCIIRGHTFMPLPGTPFENEKPGKIHPKYLETLREIEKLKRLEGYWREQEELAEKIHKYIIESLSLRSSVTLECYR